MRVPGAPHPWPKFGFSVFYNLRQKNRRGGNIPTSFCEAVIVLIPKPKTLK